MGKVWKLSAVAVSGLGECCEKEVTPRSLWLVVITQSFLLADLHHAVPALLLPPSLILKLSGCLDYTWLDLQASKKVSLELSLSLPDKLLQSLFGIFEKEHLLSFDCLHQQEPTLWLINVLLLTSLEFDVSH